MSYEEQIMSKDKYPKTMDSEQREGVFIMADKAMVLTIMTMGINGALKMQFIMIIASRRGSS